MSVLESTAEVPDQISSSHGAVGPSQQDPAAKRLQPFPKCEKDTNRNLPQRLDPCISQQRCGPLVDSRLPSDSAFQLPHTNASASRYSIPLRGPSARAREIGPVAKGGLWARGEGGGEPPAPPGWDRGDCPLPSPRPARTFPRLGRRPPPRHSAPARPTSSERGGGRPRLHAPPTPRQCHRPSAPAGRRRTGSFPASTVPRGPAPSRAARRHQAQPGASDKEVAKAGRPWWRWGRRARGGPGLPACVGGPGAAGSA